MRHFGLICCCVLFACCVACWADELVQVTEDFSSDPGWDNSNNRCVAIDPPMVRQDFGWSAGRIGGTIYQSTTPAWYGMPMDRPLTFKDRFSASGKIAVQPGSGTAYLGWFNHERQGWRPWSSMALRVVCAGDEVSLFIDAMSGKWAASGVAEIKQRFPADGSEHTWRFSYDPDATRPQWTDTRLRSYLSTGRQQLSQILEKAKKDEPEITREALEQRLQAALQQGLVTWLARHRTEYWLLKEPDADLLGEISVQIDDGPVYKSYMRRDVRDHPVQLDRFGIFNMQMYHRSVTFYVSDLVVNGQKIDLSKDPGWEGRGNRVTFAEQDFQRQDFGYSPDTNHAGGQKGEIGGQFYNVEPIDPLHGYYAAEVGKLTLDDPIRFSGRVSFIEGSTDAGMFFGYFSAEDEKKELPPNVPNSGGVAWPQPNTLGIVVDGPARIGWFFSPYCTAATRELSVRTEGPVFHPTRVSRRFEFVYDPSANNGVGRITVRLDGHEPFSVDLKPEQRKAGATFDRFGLMSFRRGGKFSTLFFDDLTYTARRPAGYQPTFHKQQITRVQYPPGGRKY
ncbi:hypothetical protein [Fontivita pretiosa]|uniref:hypothetical protein n=1 Tax=Fontivita pretiosa TaxID=2989684 RepID=UPI003D16AF67